MRGDSLRTLSVEPGQRITARRENELVRRIADLNAGTAPGRRSLIGSSSSSTSIITPFTIFLSSTSITIQPGTINQFLPTNMFTVLSYTLLSTVFIKINVTTDGRVVTGAVIASEATPTAAIGTAANAGPTTFSILLGVISSSTIYQTWIDGNIRESLLLAVTESVAAPAPGGAAFTNYYTWKTEADS